ncbi:sensor histidine kinase [Corynebacterium yonathiae]|uniref:histidine kinase n=1 Tax=Corynebacterium yonathiae TaxID=2913504 RepID=A0A9X3M0R4_9CORY|nr:MULTISPECIES: sensor histidine kinase [Corynebacterium]MCZ9296588.1 sensor histidine kinase [Corynebacterium yonathiae]MDK2583385.1 sensor histidine kinase [Corynebacterium sp. BWA136]
MFTFLLVFGVARAYVDNRLDARVIGLAVVLAVVYAAQRWLPTWLWLGGLCLLWLGLMVHAQDFMWLEFPLIFVFLRALPTVPGLVSIAILWAAAAFIPAWLHPEGWSIAAAVGPLIGTAFATAVFFIQRRLQAEAAHHRDIAKQLRETQAELAASEHQAGRLEERERLSREIHDTVAQGLSSILLLSRAARGTTDPETKEEQLAVIEEVASENLAEARRFVRELAGPDERLETQLNSLLSQMRSRVKALGKDTTFELVVSGSGKVPARIKEVIIRAAQEGLNNVIKHAHASRAVVTLGLFEDAVTLDVVDNGRGLSASPGPESADHGFGLSGLRGRVEGVGGTMNLESGEGTALAVRIPLEERNNG